MKFTLKFTTLIKNVGLFMFLTLLYPACPSQQANEVSHAGAVKPVPQVESKVSPKSVYMYAKEEKL